MFQKKKQFSVALSGNQTDNESDSFLTDVTANSIANHALIKTLSSAKFDQIRAGYSLKFQKYDKQIYLKDENRARHSLQVSNGLIERQDFRQALKHLNEGILHADHQPHPDNDSQLSEFLQQRTLCFRRLDYLEECVDDVDSLLLIGGIGGRTKDRLRKWRGECRQRLAGTLNNLRSEQDATSSLLVKIEKFKASNQLYGASDALRMQISPSAGRGLYAARSVEEGELLLVQKPYASVLSPTLLTRYCNHCLRKLSKLGAFFPCRLCTQVRYCSAQCERNAWAESHEIECAYLDLLNYSQDFHLQPRLAMRVLLKGGFLKKLLKNTTNALLQPSKSNDEASSQQSKENCKNEDSKKLKKRNRKQKNSVEQSPKNNFFLENKPEVTQKDLITQKISKSDQPKKRNRRRPNRNGFKSLSNNLSLAHEGQLEFEWADAEPFSQCDYHAICSLRTHADECPDFGPPVCLLLLFLAERCGQSLNTKQLQQLGCKLLQHLQQIHCNSKYILGRQLRSELPSHNNNLALIRTPNNNTGNELMLVQEHRLGLAMYTTYSLINHDCEPNTLSFHFDGNRLHLRALRALKPGEQLTISYGVSAMWHSRAQRTDFLKRFYFFECDCSSCMRNQDALCSAFRCAQCSGPIVVNTDLATSETSATTASDRKCSRCGWTMKRTKLSAMFQFASNCEQQLNQIRSTLASQDKNVASAVLNELEQLQGQSRQILHEHHQLNWKLLQLQSVACRQSAKHDRALQLAEQAFSNIEKFWCGSAYSAHFNARITLLDRQLAFLKQNSSDDRLRLNYLKNLKIVKQWMDLNLAPNTDEYMYLLSFLSLCFSSYSALVNGSSYNDNVDSSSNAS